MGEAHRLSGQNSRGHDRQRRVLRPGDVDSAGERVAASDLKSIHAFVRCVL